MSNPSGGAGVGRVRTTGRAIAAAPGAVRANPTWAVLATLQFLVGFVATLVALREFLWNDLGRDLQSDVLPEAVVGEAQLISYSPWDILALQATIAVVVGVVVAAPTVVYSSRKWLRERGRWPREGVSPASGALLVVGSWALFGAGVAAGYEVVVPVAIEAVVALDEGVLSVANPLVPWWYRLVAALSLSVGLAATIPPLASAGARTGVLSPDTAVGDALLVTLGVALVGLVLWPLDLVVQAAWLVPVLGALTVAIAAVVVQ